MPTLQDLGLREFPFKNVPPTEATSFWVGRVEFKSELEDLVATWTHRPDSGIYLLWADFGAGKTHALRYLQYLASTLSPPASVAYCELPKETRSFKSVYEQIARQLPERALIDQIRIFREEYGDQWLEAPELQGDRDTPRVLWALAQTSDQPQGEIARKWLRGETLLAAERRIINNISPIKTSDDATRTLGTICRLLVRNEGSCRLVLMLDEFQRIGEASAKRLYEVNSGIHTLYNSCPTGLAVILTYSFGRKQNINYLVSDELKRRVTKMYNLESLSIEDSVSFVHELVGIHMLPEFEAEIFTKAAIKDVVTRLDHDTDSHLTPSNIMDAFRGILDTILLGSNDRPIPLDTDAALHLYRPPVADQLAP